MVEILSGFGDISEYLILALGYAGVMLAMALVTPELVLPFAGFLVARGDLTFIGVILAGCLGAMISQLVLYGLAYRIGGERVRSFVRRHGRWFLLREQDFDRALVLFERYDNWLLLFGRFIPSIRVLVSLPAGIHRIPLARFVLMTAAGTLIWNVILVYTGAALGKHWTTLLELLGIYEQLVWALFALLLLLMMIRRFKPVAR